METKKDTGSRIIKPILFIVGTAIIILWCASSTSFTLFGGMHDAGAYVETWLDTNGNGKQDSNESSLPNVCVWGGYQFSSWDKVCDGDLYVTDSNGKWSEFFAGGSCNQIYIAAKSPQGYRPTTPLIVNGCSAQFGFMPSNSASGSLSPDVKQYIQQKEDRWLSKIGIGIILFFLLLGFLFSETNPSHNETG